MEDVTIKDMNYECTKGKILKTMSTCNLLFVTRDSKTPKGVSLLFYFIENRSYVYLKNTCDPIRDVPILPSKYLNRSSYVDIGY